MKGNNPIIIDLPNKYLTCDPRFSFGWLTKYIEDFLRLKLIIQKATLIHCSGVEKDGKSYAFLGWSGSGKSVIMVGLTAKGYNFISEDKIILSKKGRIYSYPVDMTFSSSALKAQSKILKPRILERIKFGLEAMAKPFAKSRNYGINQFFNYLIESSLKVKRVVKVKSFIKKGIIDVSNNPSIFLLEKSKIVKKPRIEPIDVEEFATKCQALATYESSDIIILTCQYDFLRGPKQSVLTMMHEILLKEREIFLSINPKKLIVPEKIDIDELEKILP